MTKINPKELETILRQVKEDPSRLKGASAQSFDICAAAILAAAEHDKDEVLKYVDPEFRTASLLKKAGIDSNDYDDEPFQYRKEWNPTDTFAYITLYGKCSSSNLEAAQKMLRRSLEVYADSWESVWQGFNPFLADFYEVEFVPDKNYFAMEFRFTNNVDSELLERFRGVIFNHFWDENDLFPASVIEELELFYSFSFEDYDFCGCGYCIEKLVEEDFDNLVIEENNWDFRLDDEKSRELCDVRVEYTRKRLALWLLDGGGDENAMKRAMKDLREWGKKL